MKTVNRISAVKKTIISAIAACCCVAAVAQDAGRRPQNDPLNGDNGMPTSPLAPLVYGPVNIGFDVNGNAIEAVDSIFSYLRDSFP